MSSAITEPGVSNGVPKASATAGETTPRILLRPSPHVHAPLTAKRAMYDVIIALVPAALASVWLFGWQAAAVLVACVAASLCAEALALRLRGKPVSINDGSAAVTGLLLGLTLPPHSPIWMCVIGGFVAISLGKHVFGGLGSNPFNPALVARVFLLISFPDLMTHWVAPFDAATSATPLKAGIAAGSSYLPFIWGTHAGSLGETSTVALLIGAAYLLIRRIIDWRLPAAILGTTAAMALAVGANPVFHLMSGGLIIGAFFMATDWVTSPITAKGRVFYGIGIGLLTMVIRLWGNFPEGVSFAILFMNTTTPLLNEFTRPRPQTVSVQPKATKSGKGALARILITMAVVASVSGAILALFYGMMNPRIVERRRQEMEASFQAIFPTAASFTPVDLKGKQPKRVTNPVYSALDAEGKEVGVAFMATSAGFQGDITLAIGIDRQAGNIAGVRVLAHTETAGLGSKIEGAAYIDQYIGKSLSDAFVVKQDVDGISGATISSAAVANGVRDNARGVVAALTESGR